MNQSEAEAYIQGKLSENGSEGWADVGQRLSTDNEFFDICHALPSLYSQDGSIYRLGRILTPDDFVPENMRIRLGKGISDPEMYASMGNIGYGNRITASNTAYYRIRNLTVQIRNYFPSDQGWQYYLENGDCVTENAYWLSQIAVNDVKKENVAFLDRPLRRFGVFSHPERKIAGISTPCMTVFGRKNYFHFIVDQLPFLLYPETLPALDGIPFVFTKFHPMQREICEVFGVNIARIKELCDHMPDPSMNAFAFSDAYLPGFVPMPERVHYLRTILKADKLENGTLKIFISRKPMPGAISRVVNNEELEKRMAAAGFMVLYPEEHTVAEQRELFSKAKIVVGVHGAGLTNMLFAPKNALLVEIMNEYSHASKAGLRESYRRLAAIAGQHYARLVCPAISDTPLTEKRDQDYKVVCDPDRLLRLIDVSAEALVTGT